MKAISMTIEQTARYDDDDKNIIREMHKEAETIRDGDETIEIYTADGILVDVIQD